MGSVTMMKRLVIALSVLFISSVCAAADNFLKKEDANSILRSKTKFINGMPVLSKTWDTICDFNSVEAWSEFQDELEETDLPEPVVETIEGCVTSCKYKDHALDF